MVKQLLAISMALLAAAATAHAAPPVRTMYNLASEKEQTARAALSDRAPSIAALKSVRAAIASYESLVRRYPTSSYSDNALWQAGRLALDAFDTLGDLQDRDTAVRLLRWLGSEYPTSKAARQVPDALAKLDRPARPSGQTTPDRATQADSAVPLIAAANLPRSVPPAPGVPGPSTVPRPSTVAKQPANISVPAAPSVTAAKPATITAIRRAVLPDVVRVIIALDYEVPFHEERITGPSRIFIDFPTTRAAPSLTDQTLRFDDDGDLVRQVRIGRHPHTTTRVVLDATDVSSYSVYPLYSPYRLVIDCLRPARGAPRLTAAAAGVMPLPARSIRLKPEAAIKAPKPNAVERIPASPARLASRRIIPRSTGTLPFATPGATAALHAAYVPPLSSRTFTLNWGQRLPLTTAGATVAIAQALAPEALTLVASPTSSAASLSSATSSPPAPSSGSSAPSASSSSPLSMARQLGLGVSRIVIDPGHGGHDPGAKGKGGATEAELVLDVSRRLQKLLEKVPGVEVILTRDSDCFVPLQERTAIANREGADLFLSVHANASANDQAHGVETYFLNFANNLGAASVAARENAASGQSMGALPDFVKAIALNNKLDESRNVATIVQQSMVDRLRQSNKTVKNLGVKQAPFVVLIGASMPSVLAEISFVTNPQEAKLLKSNAYRQAIAEALFNAVRKYQTSLTPRTVASR